MPGWCGRLVGVTIAWDDGRDRFGLEVEKRDCEADDENHRGNHYYKSKIINDNINLWSTTSRRGDALHGKDWRQIL